jgi:hypothetical protein
LANNKNKSRLTHLQIEKKKKKEEKREIKRKKEK